MKRLIKYSLTALALVAVVGTVDAQSLKDIYNKGKKKVEEIKKEKDKLFPSKGNTNPTNGNSVSNNSNNKSNKNSTKKVVSEATAPATESEISDELFYGGEISPYLKTLTPSNMFKFCDRKFPRETPEAPNVITVTIDGNLDYFSPFYDGMAYVVSRENGSFFIDKEGHKVFNVKCEYNTDANSPKFDNGVVMVVPKQTQTNGSAMIYNKKGTLIKELTGVSDASNFADGVAAVSLNVKDGSVFGGYQVKYVDSKGNYVFPELSFTSTNKVNVKALARKSSEGLTAFCKMDKDAKEKWGFRDATGRVVIQPQYAAVADFKDGLCAVLVKGEGSVPDKWGFIDKSGNFVIPAKYTNAPSDFDSGLAMVVDRNKKAYYIDKAGNIKLGPVDGNVKPEEKKDGVIVAISPFYNGYAVVRFLATEKIYNNVEATQYLGVIDPNFNIISWGEANNINGGIVGAFGTDGQHYVVKNPLEVRYCSVEMPDMLRKNNEILEPYRDGLSRIGKNPYSKISGYVDESGNIVIKIVKNDF